MPSISAARLRELEAEGEFAQRLRSVTTEQAQKIAHFKQILGEIVDVARGAQGTTVTSSSGNYAWSSADADVVPPSKTERQATELRELNRQIVKVEARLAAVIAVSEFAKEHHS